MLPQTPADISVEPVKPVMNIEVKDSLMSVDISDMAFADVMKEIAEKAKFKVEISGEIANKKITTSFKDVDIERGLRRMLTILKEKNFTISYTAEGLIDKLEIYGGDSIKSNIASQPKQRSIRRPTAPVTPPPPAPKTQPMELPPKPPEVPNESNP
ncbi:MAG: hypothetical protein HY754_16000 [Nitrospirae bacterium]|nr:hypothetical protein [Nitrospirota bacterium]